MIEVKKGQYECRQLTAEEVDQSIRLSMFAFQFELPESEWETARKQLRPEQLWGCFADGKLAAQVLIIPLVTYIHGKKFAMGGVANVATYPEFRRGGMIAGLLGHGLRAMKESGQSVSFLTPFKFSFYRKYGWETYVDRKKYTINADQLPKIDAAAVSGSIARIPEDVTVISPIYERYASRYSGMLSRDEEWWQNRIFRNRKGQIAVYTDASGIAQGYVHYQVKNRELSVHELVVLNREAHLAIWKFIGQHDSMIDRVVLRVPTDDFLPFELDDPRIKQEIEPYFMARIVDVEAFVRQYPFVPSGNRPAEWSAASPIKLRFDISDEHAPWNEGRFALTVGADGSASMQREPSADGEADMCCSIQTLTALLMGYRKAAQLQELGRLDGKTESIRLLSALIPERTTYLSDFF